MTKRILHTVKLHEQLSLSGSIVNDLFPFHCLFNEQGNKLESVGAALEPLLPSDYLNSNFTTLFKIVRPDIQSLTTECLQHHTQSCVFLALVDSDIVLRGQFVIPTPNRILFVGSVLAQSADFLDGIGINLKDFAPFDLTPDVVILRKFREIETNDLKKRTKMLAEMSESCEIMSEHAYTDELTKITNRRGFWHEGTKILNKYKNDNQHTLVLALLDLDGFKQINDEHGHDAGDAILCEVAERMQDTVNENGLAGRLGGDEFVLILILENQQDLQSHVESVLQEINLPFQHRFRQLPIYASIGVTKVNPDDTLEYAIHNADQAMYEGRKDTRGLISWYSVELAKRIEEKNQMLDRLKDAINDGLIEPHFQPIIDFESFELASFEALARWNDAIFGMVRPDIFIALAEELGMLSQLDQTIMEKALDQLAQWHSEGKQYSLHVNVSAASLKHKLVDRVVEAISTRNIDSQYLRIELTETTIIENTDSIRDILDRLCEHGIKLALDDFGTGYSALTHIKDFPVSGLKIDRSFVTDAHTNEKSKALLRSVATIAKNMQLYIIAEGIETAEQLEFLRNIGCQYGQGFYIGRPAASHTWEILFPQQNSNAA